MKDKPQTLRHHVERYGNKERRTLQEKPLVEDPNVGEEDGRH